MINNIIQKIDSFYSYHNNVITQYTTPYNTNTQMKHFISMMRFRFFNQNIKPLGRWKLDYCSKKMNRKIDMSNEDHCGPCGQYIIIRQQSEKETTNAENTYYNHK